MRRLLACALMLASRNTIAAVAVSLAWAGAAHPQDASWPQWGGPDRNFIVESGPLAESWPEDGPPVVWSRPLGTGHSSIVSDGERLYTMYRVGNGREKAGPWEAEEIVVALDPVSGETLWEHVYASEHADFNFGAGPHATPLVAGGRVFTAGTNKQLYALDARTGAVVWNHDLIDEYDAPPLLMRAVVKAGYGGSPVAFGGNVIVTAGGPGQSVMAFRQSDGALAWASGDFLVSPTPPVLTEVSGEAQLVVVGGGTINGLDPNDGTMLWSFPHDPGNDLNIGMPFVGADDLLIMSTAYESGSRALRLTRSEGGTTAEEAWFTSRTRFMFLNAVRVGDHLYGTTGDFGPSFLTALNVHTGEPAWRHRGFSRASLLFADGKAIVLDEDGDLAIAHLSPDEATVLAEAKIFDTTTWTAPSLVGTILYARDREKAVAVDLGVQ